MVQAPCTNNKSSPTHCFCLLEQKVLICAVGAPLCASGKHLQTRAAVGVSANTKLSFLHQVYMRSQASHHGLHSACTVLQHRCLRFLPARVYARWNTSRKPTQAPLPCNACSCLRTLLVQLHWLLICIWAVEQHSSIFFTEAFNLGDNNPAQHVPFSRLFNRLALLWPDLYVNLRSEPRCGSTPRGNPAWWRSQSWSACNGFRSDL